MGIKDDKQRLEIIKECITDMTVKKVGNRKYIIRVYSLMVTSPNEYYYINRGSVNELYWINGIIEDENNINVEKELEEGNMIPIENEIERRFERGE